MELTEFILRNFLAIAAGAVIGFEREWSRKDAGLKTNALVSLGACVFILVSFQFAGDESVDITRVLSQVVTGIGFIGAGTILQHGKKVEGITTAATIWCSAGAGCLAATGMFKELAVLSGMVVIVNFLFSYIEHKLFPKANYDDE